MKVFDKVLCKRKKCPYFNVRDFAKCACCEWNPKSVWTCRRAREGKEAEAALKGR